MSESDKLAKKRVMERGEGVQQSITEEFPISILPISNRVRCAFQRRGIREVSEILDILRTKGREGLTHPTYGVKNIGEKSADEVYNALECAGIEIPQPIEPSNQDSEALEEEIAAEEEPIRRFKKIEPPAARLIILEPGESFKTGISLCGGCWVKIECNGRSLAVKASRIVIEAEG